MPNMIAPIDMFINTFIIWDPVEISIKGARERSKIPKSYDYTCKNIG
jgi:hypothetical protein